MSNCNSLFAIINGLSSFENYIKKLSKEKKEYEKLLSITLPEKNYQNLRFTIKKVKPPCIPYFGMYLNDISLIENSNKKYIGKFCLLFYLDGLINIDKCRLLSSIIQDLQVYQINKYHFQKCDELYNNLKNI
jgi:hypothetical protein